MGSSNDPRLRLVDRSALRRRRASRRCSSGSSSAASRCKLATTHPPKQCRLSNKTKNGSARRSSGPYTAPAPRGTQPVPVLSVYSKSVSLFCRSDERREIGRGVQHCGRLGTAPRARAQRWPLGVVFCAASRVSSQTPSCPRRIVVGSERPVSRFCIAGNVCLFC